MNPNQSKTPRTDKAIEENDSNGFFEYARQLETELNQAIRERDEANQRANALIGNQADKNDKLVLSLTNQNNLLMEVARATKQNHTAWNPEDKNPDCRLCSALTAAQQGGIEL